MKKDYRNIFLISLLSLFSTFLVWLPFFLRLTNFWQIPLLDQGMATVMKNFDGLYYIVVAKSFYRPEIIESLFSFPLPSIYYTAHFPIYPLLIRLFSPIFGYLWGMLSVTLISSVLASIVFYFFLKEFRYSKQALWLTLVFLLLPARWLVVRSVGSPEPLFILFILTSFYFFKKKNYWLAGIFGTLTQLTKPPGILLFVGYSFFLLAENWAGLKKEIIPTLGNIFKKAYPLLLIPLSLLGLFVYYRFAYGDFWAYFHSGENIHPIFWPPFQVFNLTTRWVGTFWLEDIIYLFLLEALGITLLFKQKRFDIAIFSAVFFIATLFVAHRDISRYSLPLVPFLLIAFEPLLIKKEFKIALAIIIIPIFLYAINFVAGNTSPLADWKPFL
ncbi:MAG: glycosyltransferase family 39 protein [Candidatus Shapirobacteria bacterium]|nr:glycosyltransferase family 39 protein [Candidatus Shapirobacteria bacterium]